MPPDKLQIFPVNDRLALKSFIQLPYRLYQKDPHWIPPLYQERLKTLHPKKNPYYRHATVRLFLAKQDGRVLGRISAQVDHEYEKYHGEKVGHFGFFECVEDPTVAGALFENAESFLRKQGVKRVLGPYSFSSNEESGLLVEGYDQPMMIMMPYNPPYYAPLIESAGYQKAKDLFAWYYEVGKIPEAPRQIAEAVAQHPGLVVRPLNQKDFKGDLKKIMDVFNSAWAENWGFVPLTQAEIHQAAKDLKMFMDPEIAFLAELDGEPIGMCLSAPNVYELIKGLNGRLFPLGIFRLLWRIKKRKYKNGRLMLLGIKKQYRGSALGALSVLLYVEIHRRGLERGYEFGELSWTLEDNTKVNQGIEFMGGKKYKTMRIFEKKL